MGSATSQPAPVHAASASDNEKQQGLSASLAALQITPTSASGSLSLDRISAWESSASADPKTRLARTILSHSDIRSALTSRSARIADAHIFNNLIEFKTGPITNQKSSGRCWIFATTNVMRYNIMKKQNLKEFELSQACLLYRISTLTSLTYGPLVIPVLLGQTQQS